MSDDTTTMTAEGERQRAARIARYKQERRAQLDTQFSARMTTSTTRAAAPGDGDIPSTRTSRLRAAAREAAAKGDDKTAGSKISPGRITEPVRKKSETTTISPTLIARKTSTTSCTTTSTRKPSTSSPTATLRRTSTSSPTSTLRKTSTSSPTATLRKTSTSSPTSTLRKTSTSSPTSTLRKTSTSSPTSTLRKTSTTSLTAAPRRKTSTSPSTSVKASTNSSPATARRKTSATSPSVSLKSSTTSSPAMARRKISATSPTTSVKASTTSSPAVSRRKTSATSPSVSLKSSTTSSPATTRRTITARRGSRDKVSPPKSEGVSMPRKTSTTTSLRRPSREKSAEKLGNGKTAEATTTTSLRRPSREKSAEKLGNGKTAEATTTTSLRRPSREKSAEKVSNGKAMQEGGKKTGADRGSAERETRRAERDKTAQRMSQLNLGLSHEAAQLPAYPSTGDDGVVRRRPRRQESVQLLSVSRLSTSPRGSSSSPRRSPSADAVQVSPRPEDAMAPSREDAPRTNGVHEPARVRTPVSILKRKTSRDDPPVVHVDVAVRAPGILKKHASLDEGGDSDAGRPILKRRSSLEELVRRAQSPDPTSILKRRESREEDSPGILKRPAHVSIATAAELVLAADQGVKPILKKISSDEYATADSSSDGTPRPILKKKSDADERPMRTILKTSRKSSCEQESELEAVLRKRRSLEASPMEAAALQELATSAQHDDEPGKLTSWLEEGRNRILSSQQDETQRRVDDVPTYAQWSLEEPRVGRFHRQDSLDIDLPRPSRRSPPPTLTDDYQRAEVDRMSSTQTLSDDYPMAEAKMLSRRSPPPVLSDYPRPEVLRRRSPPPTSTDDYQRAEVETGARRRSSTPPAHPDISPKVPRRQVDNTTFGRRSSTPPLFPDASPRASRRFYDGERRLSTPPMSPRRTEERTTSERRSSTPPFFSDASPGTSRRLYDGERKPSTSPTLPDVTSTSPRLLEEATTSGRKTSTPTLPDASMSSSRRMYDGERRSSTPPPLDDASLKAPRRLYNRGRRSLTPPRSPQRLEEKPTSGRRSSTPPPLDDASPRAPRRLYNRERKSLTPPRSPQRPEEKPTSGRRSSTPPPLDDASPGAPRRLYNRERRSLTPPRSPQRPEEKPTSGRRSSTPPPLVEASPGAPRRLYNRERRSLTPPRSAHHLDDEDEEEQRPLSVADRVKGMEVALATGAVPKARPRDNKARFMTQPITREDFHDLRTRAASPPAMDAAVPTIKERMKAMAEEAKSRRRAPRDAARFQTQPVTPGELQQALAQAPDKEDDDEEANSDAASKLSLAERVRYFNTRAAPDKPAAPPPPPTRKRSARFKTQPVTMDELGTAIQLRVSPLAAAFVRPPDIQELGTMSVRAAREKMFEHAQQTLLRGILKPSPSDQAESDASVLRSALKKESSTEEADPRSILKTESSDFKSSSSKEESAGSNPGRPDLPDILYGVEKEQKRLEKERVDNLNRQTKEELEKRLKSKQMIDEFNRSWRKERLNGSARSDETSEGESSGGREVKKIIRNEAVARRRQQAVNKQRNNASAPLTKSQSQGVVSEQSHTSLGFTSAWDDVAPHPISRSMTQPMDQEVRPTSSIADRLAALEKRGNTDWQKRLPKLKAEDDLAVINNRINIAAAPLLISSSLEPASPADSVVADRRGKLDAASEGWRKRVEPSDALAFSVAGRMRDTRAEVIASPIIAAPRQKRTPRANKFHSKAQASDAKSTPTSPLKDPRDSFRFKRSVSAPGGEEDSGDVAEGCVVSVPRADDETFTSFFASFSSTSASVHLDVDLDAVGGRRALLAVQRRTVKTQRRTQRCRNPLRSLAARTDLKQEYTEVCTGVAEKELRRIQVEKLAKGSNLAIEALAGLASREDFSAVPLRSASSAPAPALLPYKDLMLLHVKGRRHVQTRLVAPVAASVNSGDCFVLVTPNKVYHWMGKYANVIETARGAEVALLVAQRRDLGCSADTVTTIVQGGAGELAFWRLLGADAPCAAQAGHPDEDEIYESAIVDTNMVYQVADNHLVPVNECWGSLPRIELLDPAKVLVFDLGSELYVWCGKNAAREDRRAGTQLAQEMFHEGFDYTDCDICPVTAAQELGSRKDEAVSARSGPRPAWCLLAKVSQHMETVLFREKFLDWPDFTRVIGVREDEARTLEPGVEVKPCDAQEMFDHRLPDPSLELEGSQLGRGTEHFDVESGRRFAVSTVSVSAWHVDEFEHTLLGSDDLGQFHEGDSYIVRWLYTVTPVARELSGLPSKHTTTGRERCVYFCWQGASASLNEQGAAALTAVELDSERGAQLRVTQGAEPPAFLALFRGAMVIHAGRRSAKQDPSWRLYMSRGETETEACLTEVASSSRQLRSRACLLALDPVRATLAVWQGCQAPPHAKQVARAAARAMARARQDFTMQTIDEGSEPAWFLSGVSGPRQLYDCLLDARPQPHTPRLFRLTSTSGAFQATEIAGAYRLPSVPGAFPFLQSELYSASQPALFLLDSGAELWLWQGWWPPSEGKEERGGAAVRWQAERRAAMHTAVHYREVCGERSGGRLVWAGLEPLHFTNLFPLWVDRDDVAAENMQEGHKPGDALSIEAELARLTQSTYPIARLLQRPLPDGVDPTRLELYLDDNHFQELLNMTKEDFEELPTWKQTKVKKEAGLF